MKLLEWNSSIPTTAIERGLKPELILEPDSTAEKTNKVIEMKPMKIIGL
jgi:hypothetical protein